MHSFREALDLLLKHTPLLPVECCRIEQAAGRVLRGEVRADRDFPPFDRVMMDGYGLRVADLDSNRKFRVTGSAPAGKPAVWPAVMRPPLRTAGILTATLGKPLLSKACCTVTSAREP